jgi:hypothetical protein
MEGFDNDKRGILETFVKVCNILYRKLSIKKKRGIIMQNLLFGSNDHDKENHDEKEVICNNICGNLLLSDEVTSLEIWKEKTKKEATITVAVFNSSMNTATINVIVTRKEGLPVEFNVPPGNTLSATVEDAKSVTVTRIGEGRTNGKFCLDVCIPFKKKDHKDDFDLILIILLIIFLVIVILLFLNKDDCDKKHSKKDSYDNESNDNDTGDLDSRERPSRRRNSYDDYWEWH